MAKPMSDSVPPLDSHPQELGEQAWIEVIRKMDEVYNDLVRAPDSVAFGRT